MATDGAIGKRRAQAIKKIIAQAERLGGSGLKLPRHSRWGAEHLAILQLEAIGDFFEQVELPVGYDSMSLPKLKALVKERALDPGKAKTKAEFISILETADEAAEAAAKAIAPVTDPAAQPEAKANG